MKELVPEDLKKIILDDFKESKIDATFIKHRKKVDFLFLENYFDETAKFLNKRFSNLNSQVSQKSITGAVYEEVPECNLFSKFYDLKYFNFFSFENIYLSQIRSTSDYTILLSSYYDFLTICTGLETALKFKNFNSLDKYEKLCWELSSAGEILKQKIISDSKIDLMRLDLESRIFKFESNLKDAFCFKNEYLRRFFFSRITDDFIDVEKLFFSLLTDYNRISDFADYVSKVGSSIDRNYNKAKENSSALFAYIESNINPDSRSLNYADGVITMPDGNQLKVGKQLFRIFDFLYSKRFIENAFSKSEIFEKSNCPEPKKISDISDLRQKLKTEFFDKYIETIGRSSQTRYRFRTDPSFTPQE